MGRRRYNDRENLRRGFLVVRRIWANPCDTPLIVFAELAAPAAGRLVIGLLAFGMLDLVRAYFRPKGLRSGRHLGRGRKGRRRGGGIPDTPELVAKLLPGYQTAKNAQWSDGTKYLWIIDTRIQAFLYYVLIFNLGKDFIAESATSIIKFEAKNCDQTASAYVSGPGNGQAGPEPQGIIMGTTEYQRGAISVGQASIGVNAGVADAVLANRVKCPVTSPIGGRIRVGIAWPTGTLDRVKWGSWRYYVPGRTVTCMASRTEYGAGSFVWYVQREGGVCVPVGGRAAVKAI
jgi:hypothetical protein